MFSELDHIVFEDRNRDYGAYPLRVRYQRLVIRAWLITAASFILIFTGILFYYLFEEEPSVSAGEIIAIYEMMDYPDDPDLPLPPDIPGRQVSETVLPKPELLTAPEVVNQTQHQAPDPEKEKTDLTDSTAKTGDLAIKSGEGADTGAVYIRVEKLPEYPGGRPALDKYLRDNIAYPPGAISRKISGIVHVSFMVDMYGRVTQVKVTRSVDPALDNEAVRVVRAMPLWMPGRRHGRPVNVLLTLPIRFMPAG